MSNRTAVIIGAGPAGLTAALQLQRETDIHPILIETESQVGGLSRTVVHGGNRMDIGGHRFFSKSDWVMDFWKEILPPSTNDQDVPGPTPSPRVLLERPRLSRIYYLKRFFDYPVKMNATTALNLGPVRLLRILSSYAWIRLFPIREEKSLQDFVINRFGRELFKTFFKDYTEKVWGRPCDQISAEWGAQRIKGLSISKALLHALKSLFPSKKSDLAQKATATSLIEQFLYPAFGPGQMWEEVADRVVKGGGDIRLGWTVDRVHREVDRVVSVSVVEEATGRREEIPADYIFSSMPVRDLVAALEPPVPESVRSAADALEYRDFLTVGVLLRRMKPSRYTPKGDPRNLLPDTWIYIQEPEVKLGRLQIFNNWSPFLTSDPEKVWVGLEYFCQEGDELWCLPDAKMSALAADELALIGLSEREDVLDAHVVRVRKAYPAYFEGYARFPEVRAYLDAMPNLHPIGRNGMHHYNNQDHSMLTAKEAVAVVASGGADKSKVWDVNVGDDYHEETSGHSEKKPGF